jgi:excisionase family DNA binding protein
MAEAVVMALAFFGRKDAAMKLGVSVATVDRQIKAGRLRAAHIGRRVVVSAQALDEFRRANESGGLGEAS